MNAISCIAGWIAWTRERAIIQLRYGLEARCR
jgi:hypothetical protein